MQTECSAEQFEFEGFGRRRVVAAFDAGAMSSDGRRAAAAAHRSRDRPD
jgi:hypothetical protein